MSDPLAGSAWGAEEVCGLVEAGARKWLPSFLPDDLDVPVVWEQLPAAEAMRTADVPAVAFSSPGLAEPPERTPDQGGIRGPWNATWTVVASVWVRGEEGTYASTTSALRRYVKALRCAVLAASADEHGNEWLWRAEEYDPAPVSAARTLQMGFVQVDVPVYRAVDLNKFPPQTVAPIVERTYVTVTKKET